MVVCLCVCQNAIVQDNVFTHMDDVVYEMCSQCVRDAGVEQMQVAQVHPVGKGAQALGGGGRIPEIDASGVERERGNRTL